MDSPTLSILGRGLNDLRISHYGQLSSACIVIFEHLITLDDEINLIWPSPWTAVKLLFLISRYYVLAAVSLNTYVLLGPAKLTDSIWQEWTELIFCVVADGILQMRLYALYSLNKKVVVLMLTSFTLALTISGYILFVLSQTTPVAVDSPFGGMFCFPSHPTPKLYLFWIPLMIFECLLFGLAVFRGLQTLRHSGPLSRNLIIILIRDSVIYFLGICITYALCVGIGILTPTLVGLPTVFAITMPCVLSNRLVLNIRATRKTLTTDRIQPVSRIKFRLFSSTTV